VPRYETLFLPLRITPPEALTGEGSVIGWALRTLQSAEEPYQALHDVLTRAIVYLDTLPEEARTQWHYALHYLWLLVMHRRREGEQETLQSLILDAAERHNDEELREMFRTGAQALMDRGREEGREEGRQEGERDLLLKLLEHKFGPLSPEVRAKAESLTEAEISDLAVRILTAQTLEEMGL
jgi:flagellar biosynthesis/type III secretory pathway protein FliH